MKLSTLSPQRAELLTRLSNLPPQILTLHDHDHVAGCVLYELCGSSCFDLKKAAFFVDNPDFDCCKGIIGFSREDHPRHIDDVWGAHQDLAEDMKRSIFNQKVRDTHYASAKKNNIDVVVNELAKRLDIKNPSYLTFPVRHQNHGVFIYQADTPGVKETHEFMPQGLSLLGFCPLV
ncbi:TPA: hypothetical protein DDZ86_03930 [Candidatus Dependentiae bacterium]|nr:MAG: hypothetical protein UW09_C0003G0140 [candidate division TM6 bacterium GW2011_GWF2_43_87]HBL98766.1 hypothetical protein [Candidatus Dependentiae bacterium]